MPLKLTPEVIKCLEISLESMDEFDKLAEGMRFVIWTYLEDHVDEGCDHRVSGNFLKNFDSLMGLIADLHKYETRQR